MKSSFWVAMKQASMSSSPSTASRAPSGLSVQTVVADQVSPPIAASNTGHGPEDSARTQRSGAADTGIPHMSALITSP